jgi:hypothetical protein
VDIRKAFGQLLQVIAPFCQHDRAAALRRELQSVLRDRLAAPHVSCERGVDLLDTRIGGQRCGIEGRVAPHDAQHERLC